LFDNPSYVAEVKLLLDTAMNRDLALDFRNKDHGMTHIPGETPRRFQIEVMDNKGWSKIRNIEGN